MNTKSGIRKLLHAREYRKVAVGVYQHAKVALAYDLHAIILIITSFTVYIRQSI